jgi:glucokinase
MKPPKKQVLSFRTDSGSGVPLPLASSRDHNSNALLRLLRDRSPVSRADLVRLSGLTAPTVSAGIAKLERRGLVVALGPGSSNGGRPPGLLEFNARHGYVIGVDIGGSFARLALADLNGEILGRWNAPLLSNRTPAAVTAMIGDAIARLLQQQNISAKKVLEMVAGVPGITDVDAGQVLSAPNLADWHEVPFRDLLQAQTHIPCSVLNDVNLGALGEGWRGVAHGAANFVFLAIGTGIGAGLVVNHTLHHGARWSAGEVGYLLLPNLASDPPSMSRPGALESAAGGKGIESAWLEMISPAAGETALTATEVFDLAMSGNQKARGLLNHTAHRLAMAITNMSLILDLSLVVLSGGVGGHPALLEAIRRRLEDNEFARPQLATSSLGGEAQIHGAIWFALQMAAAAGFKRRAVESVSSSNNALVPAGD